MITQNPCHQHQCTLCCQDTAMLLSEQDISTIESQGFHRKDFCIEKKGWIQLRNKENKCVFLQNDNCSIYSFRPQGCRYYPLIYDLDKQQVIFDIDCPHRIEFPSNDVQKNQVKKLVDQVLDQRRQRLK